MTDPLLFGLAVPGPANTLLMTSGATVGVRRSLVPRLAAAVMAGLAFLPIGNSVSLYP